MAGSVAGHCCRLTVFSCPGTQLFQLQVTYTVVLEKDKKKFGAAILKFHALFDLSGLCAKSTPGVVRQSASLNVRFALRPTHKDRRRARDRNVRFACALPRLDTI